MSRRRLTVTTAIAITVLLALACNFGQNPAAVQQEVATEVGELLQTPSYMECYWNWATRPQPELEATLIAELTEAQIPFENVTVSVFGEDCLDQNGEVQRFAAMQTDFAIKLRVTDAQDRDEVAAVVEPVLKLLAGPFAPQETPGPMPGHVTLELTGGSVHGMEHDTIVRAINQGLTGKNLLDALGL